jgi:hypothetical protein
VHTKITVCFLLALSWNSAHAQDRAEVTPQNRTMVLVEAAKSQGKTAVNISCPASEAPEVRLDDALSRYTIVIARPTATKTLIAGSHVITWYKFNVIEYLTQRTAGDKEINGPPEFKSNNPKQIATALCGGSITVNGVSINQTNRRLTKPISPGKTYLLMLQMQPSQVGVLALGSYGIFEINQEGSLRSIAPQHEIAVGMLARFGNSVEKLEKHLTKAETRKFKTEVGDAFQKM